MIIILIKHQSSSSDVFSAILPVECTFIIGFSCTVWTKMRSLTGSLADGVLADAILIPSRPPIPPPNYKEGKGSSEISNTKTIY